MNQLTPPPIRLAWTIWGLGAILYLIGFYQRVAPAVMTAELMVGFLLLQLRSHAGTHRHPGRYLGIAPTTDCWGFGVRGRDAAVCPRI